MPEMAPGIAGVLVATVIETLLVPLEPQEFDVVTPRLPLAAPHA